MQHLIERPEGLPDGMSTQTRKFVEARGLTDPATPEPEKQRRHTSAG